MDAIQINVTSTNDTKPFDENGGPPAGPFTAVRHMFDDQLIEVTTFANRMIKQSCCVNYMAAFLQMQL